MWYGREILENKLLWAEIFCHRHFKKGVRKLSMEMYGYYLSTQELKSGR